MPTPDKVEELYNALKADGAVQNSLDYFRGYMSSASNRKQLYEALKADGAVTSGTFEEFDQKLGYPYNTHDMNEANGVDEASNRAQQQAQRQAQRNMGTPGVVPNRFGLPTQQQGGGPVAPTVSAQPTPTPQPQQEGTRYNYMPVGGIQTPAANQPAYTPQRKPMAPAPKAGQWSGAPMQQTPFAPTEEEGNTQYMPLEQGEDTKARYDAAKQAVGGQGGQVQTEREKIDSLLAASEKRDMEAGTKRTIFTENGSEEVVIPKRSNETRELRAALRALDNAQKMINEANAGNKNFFASAGRGMRDKFFDVSTWDFGITDVTDQAAILRALEAYDKGEQLTESQRALLDAKAVELATTAYFGSELGRGYKAGQVTAEAIPFMIEMAINPAAGIGKGASKAMVRYALKKFGKEAIQKGGKRYVAKQAMKYGTRIALDPVGAGGMAVTTGAARTAADAMQRMAGNLHYGTDEQGNITFDGHTDAESVMKAFGKAFASTTIENYSEMLGNYFAPALGLLGKGASKVGKGIARTKAGAAVGRGMDKIGGAIENAYNSTFSKKIGLQAVGDFIGDIPAGKAAEFLSELEKRAQWHGVMGEYTEEVLGGLLNALVVGDQTLDKDPDTGLFNWDNNVDTFLGVALMGGFFSGVKTVGYGVERAHNARQYNKANRMGASAFGDGWADVQASIDNDPKAGAVAVLADPNATAEQREAALRYAVAVTARQGMEQGKAKRDAEGVQTPQEAAAEQSYNAGYEDANTDELRSNINQAYNDARKKLVGLIGEDNVGVIDEDPLGMQRLYDNDPNVSDEVTWAVAEYVSAKSAMDGVNQRIVDDAEDRAEEKREAYKPMTREDGTVHPVTLNEVGADGQPKTVYLLDGSDVVLNPDGSIDREKSSPTLTAYDPEQGKNVFINDPYGDRGIQSVGEVLTQEDYEAQIEAERQAEVERFERGNRSNRAQGARTPGAPEAYTPGMVMGVVDDAGQEHVAEVVGRVRYDKGQFVPDENGMFVEYTVDGQTRHEAVGKLNDMVRWHDTGSGANGQNGANGEPQTPAEQPQQPNTATEGQAPTAQAETPTEGGNAAATQPQSGGMPMKKDGNPDFMATTPQQGYDYIYNDAELSPEEAQEYIQANTDAANKALEDVQKKAPKMSNNLAKYKQERSAWQQKLAEAQAEVDYWQQLNAIGQQQTAAFEAPAQPTAQTGEVPDMSVDKASNARERGYRLSMGNRYDRQESTDGVEGSETEVKFANSEKPVKGRWKVVEADKVQPSHMGGMPNPMHFIPEAQPKDRTDKVSDAESDKIAANINPKEIIDGVTAYTGTPVVNSRGEVIQGNNRATALRKMGSYPESAAKYKQYLIDHAAEYGLNAEDIASMNNPVMVREVDVDDNEAIRLGQFTASDTESGGKERISADKVLGKLSDEQTSSVLNIMLRGGEETDETLMQLIDRNGADVLTYLAGQGAINDTQVQSAYGRDGRMTPEAKNDLADLVTQNIFKGGADNIKKVWNEYLPVAAQKALLQAMAGDLRLPKKARLIEYVRNAIMAVGEIKNNPFTKEAKTAEEYHKGLDMDARQADMLSRPIKERYSELELYIAVDILLTQKQNAIKAIFWDYQRLFLEKGADLFEAPKEYTREEAIEKVFGIKLNKTDNNEQGNDTGGSHETGTSETGETAGNGELGRGERSPEGESGTPAPAAGEPGAGGQPQQPAVNTAYAPTEEEYAEIKAYLDENPNASRAELQRALRLGYNKAEIGMQRWESERAAQGETAQAIAAAEAETDTNPTEGQKEAGNYKKGHVRIDGYDITIEQPKGSVRRGTDKNGRAWEQEMHNTYGYIRGTESVDGDHIDVFLSDDPTQGNVYVVDQVNEDGTFDEHKVMYGFPDMESARQAYLSNYEDGWRGLGTITPVSKEEFKKWIESSHRKTKPFSEYKGVKTEGDVMVGEGIKPVAEQTEGTPKQEPKAETWEEHVNKAMEAYDKEYAAIEKSNGERLRKEAAGYSDERLLNTYIRNAGISQIFGKGREGMRKFVSEEKNYKADKLDEAKENHLEAAPDAARQSFVQDVLRAELDRRGIEYKEEYTFAETSEAEDWYKKNVEGKTEQPRAAVGEGENKEPEKGGKGEKVKNEAAAPKEKIDDVGEKIGGARKDLAQKMGAKINLDADTFPKMFPKFDLKKAVEQGLDPKLASAVYFLRLAAQQSYKSNQKHHSKEYALNAAKFMAAYAKQFLERGDTSTEFMEGGFAFTDYGKKLVEYNLALYEKVYAKFGNTLFDLDLTGFEIVPIEKRYGTKYFRKNEKGESEEFQPAYEARAGYTVKRYVEGELDKAIDELVNRMAESVSYKESHPYKLSHYYMPGVANSHYIGVKLGGKVVALTEKMSDTEASKYLREHEAELQEKAKRLDEERKQSKQGGTNTKWKPELGLGGGRARVGNDYRNGKDVSAEKFRETFGFRGVEFGNYVTQAERQRFINEAYDAMMDLAALLNVSPRALSLGGRLGFAIGARGGGNAMAHYEPDLNVINLTKSKGAGSLAHEWWHALDYYFNRMGDRRKTPATANRRAEDFNPGQRREMEDAFVSLMEKINGSDYRKRSVALDAALSKDNYTNPTELGARAFQDYVQRRLTDRGQINDFLSSFTPEEQWNGKAETYPYPTGKDADAIDEQFDNLFGTMLEREDEQGNVMLYERVDGKAAKVSAKERKLRDAIVDLLRKAGIDVVTDSEEGQRVLDMANGRERQHRVYHGSGADFEAFDHSHMGEGEGAQAFGWGTYVTDVEGIGRHYAENLPKVWFRDTRNGVEVDLEEVRDNWDESDFRRVPLIDVFEGLRRHDNNIQEAIEVAREIFRSRMQMADEFEDWSDQKESIEAGLAFLEELSADDFEVDKNLYTVEIPEDNGSNYLEWDKPIGAELAKKLQDFAFEQIMNADYRRFYPNGEEQARADLQRVIEPESDMAWVNRALANRNISAKAISEFLHSAGFVGVKYPAEYYSGGRSDGAKNYVIFNEGDLQITDKVRFFRTESGEAYGLTMGGKIYLDPSIATAETPVHEYTHLWAEALRQANPKAWEQLKSELEKDKDLMAYVRRLYPELAESNGANGSNGLSDELAKEVFAHFSGRRGAERLREEQRKAMDEASDYVEKAGVVAMFERLRDALKKFWNAARDLFAGKTRVVEKLSAEDFADMVLGDLVGGFNPDRVDSFNKRNADIRYQRGGETFEERQRRAVAEKGIVAPGLNGREVTMVEGEKDHGFKTFDEARNWAKENIAKTYDNEETGGKGNVRISNTAIDKFLSESSVRQSEDRDIHMSVLKVLPEVIREGVDAEQHPDYKKGKDGIRKTDNGYNDNVLIHRVYGAVSIDGNTYRVKVTLKEEGRNEDPTKAYSYEATKIELLDGQSGSPESLPRNSNNSISAAKLLKNIDKSYEKGKKLLDESSSTLEDSEEQSGGASYEQQAIADAADRYKHVASLKSAEAVVRDRNGEVVPLSRRFDLGGSRYLAKQSDGGRIYREGESTPDGLNGRSEENRERFKELLDNSGLKYRDHLSYKNGSRYFSFSIKDKNGDYNTIRVRVSDHAQPKEWRGNYEEGVNDFRNYADAYNYLSKFFDLSDKRNAIAEKRKELAEQIEEIELNGEKAYRIKGNDAVFSTPEAAISNVITSDFVPRMTGQLVEDFSNIEQHLYREGAGPQVEYVTYEESLRRSKEAGYTKRQHDAWLRRYWPQRKASVERRARLLNLGDRVIVVERAEELEAMGMRLTERDRRSKGWYDRDTGKIVMILQNHTSIDDETKTLLHEGVGHYGLRYLFGEHFDEFLDLVYAAGDVNIRREIARLSAKYGYDVRSATEEYLSRMAEDEDFERPEHQDWWRKVKTAFFTMLRRIGFDIKNWKETITDNELRYVLWRSYQNLKEQGAYRNLVEVAEDMAMQAKLKVGVFEEDRDDRRDRTDRGDRKIRADRKGGDEWSRAAAEAKRHWPDAMVLERVGDFYEVHGEDARNAAKVLGLPLVQKADGNNTVGFPTYAVNTYLPKLVRAGQRVAIVDSVEEGAVVYGGEDVEAVNARFNEELQQQIDGTLPKGHVYNLGMPSGVLLSTGIADAPIQLSATKLNDKSSGFGHDYDLSEVKDLVKSINDPIAVFKYGDEKKAQNIVVEIQHNGKNFIVGLAIRPSVNGRVLEINSIRNVFPKDNAEWLNWITQDKALYLDKNRIQALIDQQRTNLADVGYLDLNSVAKIVKKFENPQIPRESFSENADAEGGKNGRIHRDGDFTERDEVAARDYYERMVSESGYQFREAVQDSMLGLRKAMEAILGGGKKFRVEEVPGNENAYLAENRMSSVNAAEQHYYFVECMKPLLEEIHKICGSDKALRQELTDYMMAKHGLERNEKFAQRDFDAYQQQNPTGGKTLGDFRERDYAGLTALTGLPDVHDAELAAMQMVADFEAQHDVSGLWAATKQATGVTLAKIYRSGLLSKESYEQIRDQFEWYIPLQGFDETTSDEVYGYLTSRQGPYGSPIKHAEGRSSKADDPIATIGMMADMAIRQANRNEMKKLFLNFVLNHPSDLVSVNRLWLQYDDVSGDWVPVFADIEESDTAADVERKVAAFEERMEQLAAAEPDKYKHGRNAKNIPYRVLPGNLSEHQVLVKRDGETYVLTINGNPRAAQALNGLTNPDVKVGGLVGDMMKAAEWVNHNLSAAYTTRTPDFVVSNYFRDMLYSNCMTWVKEGPNYALRFHKNFGKFNPASMRALFGKWEKGKLDESKPIEFMFKQFMLNGGETGYTNVRDIEAHKQEIARELKRQGNVPLKAWHALGMQLDLLNRSVENCARFAAFITSQEMGRSVERSIYDAKEVSVNFNKKGSGGKMVNATGQTGWGKFGSWLSGSGRLLFVFWNAGTQGMTNFMRAAKHHPGKFSVGAATMFALGAIIPLLAKALGDDDDDENAYYNLPEYVRRSNICFRFTKEMPWITIPLPIEFRAIYGLGELGTGVITGDEHYNNWELARQLTSQVSQMLPLDFMEGGGGLHAFIPSLAKPIVEAATNKSWTGLPIYKDTPFNKKDPEFTKVYKNANKNLVAASEWLNELTGGDDYKKGWADKVNPAQVEYVLNGYLGGWFKVPNQLMKMGETALGNREFEWRNMMLANRLIKNGDERTANRKLQNEYFELKDEYEETKRLLKKYKNAADEGVLKYAEKLAFLNESEEYGRYLIFDEYRKQIDQLYKQMKEEEGEQRKATEEEYYSVMREMVDKVHEYNKGR